MRNLFAVARRVLMQFRHDPRTIAIMIVAPCLVLWLFSALLGMGEYTPRIAAVDLPQEYLSSLESQNTTVVETDESEAVDLLEEGLVDAIVSTEDKTLVVEVEGADASKTSSTMKQVQAAIVEMQEDLSDEIEDTIDSISFEIPEEVLAQLPAIVQEKLTESVDEAVLSLPDFDELMTITGVEIEYLHGNEDWTSFDFFGPVFIGIFIFVFVFITSSMSLLTERSGGTIARLLATPVKGWQIVGGYVIGFGLVALVQSVIILWACISLIGFPNEGSLLLVGLITVSMAIVSLTLGLLVSGLARTPFQVIQLMLVFVIPQILLSGIFELSQSPEWMQTLALCFPVYHGAEALRDVMLRGASFEDIAINLLILWAFAALFFVMGSLTLRKKRAKKLSA